MIKNFISEKYGDISYEESFWTGKKIVKVNGVSLKKVNKTTFKSVSDEKTITVKIKGSFVQGATLQIEDEQFEIAPKTLWYEYILFILPFMLTIVWGNSPELCSIIPVVGGAIGGAVSASFSLSSLVLMKNQKNPLLKVAIGLGAFIITFAVCYAIAYAISSVL